MRFVKLSVEAYQAIQRAEIEFGPGLNVLYGPNDIGKSTLAAALRSALLVPPSSTLAETFTPWYADATPLVALTFLDETRRYWRIEKRFGSGSADAATLSDSKDGVSFSLDCRNRQVEEKIRAVLGWGIPGPGGKSGPKGLPTSFLASVLLAEQTDVHEIMAQSLGKDLEESGKIRLTKALAVLAQDATFKQVLDIAQEQFDTYFTAKEIRKKGQSSPFTIAGNKVKERQQQLSALEAELTESAAIEGLMVTLRQRYVDCLEASTQAAHTLEELQVRAQRDQARLAARVALESALKEVARADAHAQRVADVAATIETLRSQVKERENEAKSATREHEAAQLALRGAEEAHRLATGEGAARERELRQAQLVAKTASAAQHKQAAETQRDAVRAVLKAHDELARSEQAMAAADADQKKAELAQATSQNELRRLEWEHGEWVAAAAYARWRAAANAAEELEQVTQLAAQSCAEADATDAEAARQEAACATVAERTSARQALLPTSEQLTSLQRLDHDLQLAEAALGGGLSVQVSGRPGLITRATVDDEPNRQLPDIKDEQHLEADRRFLLSIDDVVQLELRAGSAENRKAADALRARRKAELIPVLERGGVASLIEVTREVAQLAGDQQSLQQARESIRALREGAQILRDRATEQQARAARLASQGEDIAALRAALGDADLGGLETRVQRLGSSPQTKAETRAAECLSRLDAARAALAQLERTVDLADYKLKEATARRAGQKTAYASSLTALATDDPAAALSAIEANLAAITREQAAYATELDQLAASSTTEVAKAVRAIEAGKGRVAGARDGCERATSAAEAARQQQASCEGECSALRAQLDTLDRAGLTATAQQRKAELNAFGSEPDVTPAVLEPAQRRVESLHLEHEQIKEEIHKAEGRLAGAGGAALREDVERMREARQRARDDEGEVELDAEAWKLLRTTLREVEDAEGAHLGRALAGPLGNQFRELTGGRYRNLHLNPLLKVEGVDAAAREASGTDVLAALSVGIRDQLATLIRLAIAETLGSAIILDDHLVHSDPQRLGWFRQALTKAALKAQVIVLTCRPRDYLSEAEIPQTGPYLDLAGGTIRAIDLSRVMTRYRGTASQAPESDTLEVGGKARAS